MSRKLRDFTFSAPIVSADDPHANTIAAAVVAIEAQWGEREGWNRPSHLFTLRLLPGERVETALYPEAIWTPDGVNPADALSGLSRSLPPVPDILLPADAAQAPVCAVGFMFEGWMRDTTVALPPEVERLRKMGMRVNHLLPNRREVRIVHAVDLNQRTFHVKRHRGGEADVRVAGLPDHAAGPEGTISVALARIMHAMRNGEQVLPGQPA
ncbi:hypothetical protein [Streptomyces sp. NBC_00829]|uniref:hypothetical protein n=1 Tax=Streptomyces sp. NBC_00829 TaxID=2903679 RepID=UPI002F909491|nr:hypothetical protein OG293_40430 [Streptomyces sp. NBC_00829]